MEVEISTYAGARKRPVVAPASVGAYVPEELIRDILLLLPPRSVLRFRAVCKAWLRLTSSPEFVLEYDRRQPVLPLVSFLRDAGGGTVDIADCCVEAFDLRADEFRSVARFTDARDRCDRFRVIGSCDGLLLLTFEHRVYVCNPATRQWTRLPTPLPSSMFAGFYRHEHTGEYRALFFRCLFATNDAAYLDYYILVADSRKGKGFGLPSEQDVYEFKEYPAGPPVLVRGSLHWPPQKRDDAYSVLAFNTVTEVFHPVLPPPPVTREHIMSLLEVDDELALFSCCRDVSIVELWLLHDHRWVCKHRIRLPAVNVCTIPVDEPWRVFYMAEEGVVLATKEQKLLHYDLKGNLKESFCCNSRNLRITPYTLRESIARHTFFEKQDNVGDDEDESPPFFRGL